MTRILSLFNALFYALVILAMIGLLYLTGYETSNSPAQELILSPNGYGDDSYPTIMSQLRHRVQVQPFNIIALIIFCLALLQIFFAGKITQLSDWVRKRSQTAENIFLVEFLKFMGEVEVVFGIWVIPLMILMSIYYDWPTSINYLNHIDYTQPMMIVVIMALASTAPIVACAERIMKGAAKLGNQSLQAWWWSILTVGPLLGSFITEPAAMTISALLLSKQFYTLKPSPRLAYATLGLLFTNISVGGVLTNFAAPPVLIVSKTWNWDTLYMMANFGWKAITGIVLANFLYYFFFRKELSALNEKSKLEKLTEKTVNATKTPLWIIIINIFFLAWIVVHANYPVIFVASFLLFLGFHHATHVYQGSLDLKPAILVGYFLAGLLIHGTLQAWWISPFLSRVTSEESLMLLSMVLTAFNDNAEITFLASLMPNFDEALKYAIVSGAVAGGGLTLIANAPNLTGQSILGRYFYPGISAWRLCLGALIPALTIALCFYLL